MTALIIISLWMLPGLALLVIAWAVTNGRGTRRPAWGMHRINGTWYTDTEYSARASTPPGAPPATTKHTKLLALAPLIILLSGCAHTPPTSDVAAIGIGAILRPVPTAFIGYTRQDVLTIDTAAAVDAYYREKELNLIFGPRP